MLGLLILAFFSTKIYAVDDQNDSVVARAEGASHLFALIEGAQMPANCVKVQLDAKNYCKKQLVKGDRPRSGDRIKTGKDGKVRMIFRNGDQITLLGDTDYAMTWNRQTKKGFLVSLAGGDMRSVINKTGPRNDMKVQTRTSVIGVRGTDFSTKATDKNVQVKVLRGKAAVFPKEGGNGVVIPNGFSGDLPSGSSVSNLNMKPFSLGDFDSYSAKYKVPRPKVDGDAKLSNELSDYEKSSSLSMLDDVKQTDSSLYDSLIKQGAANKDSDEIQDMLVAKLKSKVPSPVNDKKDEGKKKVEDLKKKKDKLLKQFGN